MNYNNEGVEIFAMAQSVVATDHLSEDRVTIDVADEGNAYISTENSSGDGGPRIYLSRKTIEELFNAYLDMAGVPTRKVYIENYAEDATFIEEEWTEAEIKTLKKLERLSNERRPIYGPTFKVKEES